jgi:hypothetical protein
MTLLLQVAGLEDSDCTGSYSQGLSRVCVCREQYNQALQGCREVPAEGFLECDRWGGVASIQTAWLLRHYIRPVRGFERQVGQLPAMTTRCFIRVQILLRGSLTSASSNCQSGVTLRSWNRVAEPIMLQAVNTATAQTPISRTTAAALQRTEHTKRQLTRSSISAQFSFSSSLQ